METKNQLVLVTGGSGFIAVHIILKLLKEGYCVRTTLRTMSRQDEVKSMLAHGGITNFESLEFIQADLTSEKNWDKAVAGATYAIHVASPTPAVNPRNEDEMIRPAVDGVLRVLRAAKAAKVKRVVLTSSFGAIGAGHKEHNKPFTEKDWTDTTAKIHPYQKSKTLAEKAAWEFVANEGKGLELATVNPVAVMGPVLGKDYSHSNKIIRLMLAGKMKAVLKMTSDYVDVRDVADLHLLAMTRPEAAGERFLATTGENLSMIDEANILQRNLGEVAKNVPTKELPNFVVKLAAFFVPSLRMPAKFLGQNTQTSNLKAKQLLNWQPRSAEEAILATAQSMIELNLINE